MKIQASHINIDSRWTAKYNSIAVSFNIDVPGFGRVSPNTAYLKQNFTTSSVKFAKGFMPDSLLTIIDAIDAKLKGINVNELPIKEWNNKNDNKPVNNEFVAAADKFKN